MRKGGRKIRYVEWYPPAVVQRRRRVKLFGGLAFLVLALTATVFLYSIWNWERKEARATPYQTQPLDRMIGEVRAEEGWEAGWRNIKIVRVLRGQSLWETLTSIQFPIRQDELYGFLEAFMRLNPEVKDIGVIPAGKEIKIPLRIRSLTQRAWPRGAPPRIISAKRGSGVAREVKPPPPSTPKPSTSVADKGAPSEKGERGVEEVPTIPLLERTLHSLFVGLEENYVSEGLLYLPLGRDGNIRIDLRALPLVEVSSGKRLLLDMKGSLPVEVKELIESTSPDYKVVELRSEKSWEGVFNQVFSLAGYYAVRPLSSIVLGNKAKVVFKGDWVVVKGEDSLLKGKVNIINLLRKAEPSIPRYLVDYARKSGIQISEIIVSGDKGPDTSPSREGLKEDKMGEFIALDPGNREGMVDFLLELLHQKYESQVNVTIIEDPKAGYSIEIKAGRLVKGRDGLRYIVDFSDLPEGLARIAKAHGYSIVRLAPDKPTSAIEKILKLAQMAYQDNPSDFWESLEPQGSRVRVRVPGFIISSDARPRTEKGPSPHTGPEAWEGSPILITDTELDEDVKRYLMGKGLRIIKY
ncbi:MAG: hypothetical protein HY998_00055 [candidate division NC10 bacterium]|nr:hypothetical protein [candidate division NC10 bacterium]